MSRIDYLAGIFDGEGWFQISRTVHGRHKRDYQYQLHAALEIRESVVPEMFAELFGGTVRLIERSNPAHAHTFRWRTTGENARIVAESLLPSLVIKRLAAETAIAFQGLKGLQGNRPLSDETYSSYCTLFDKMAMHNRRGKVV